MAQRIRPLACGGRALDPFRHLTLPDSGGDAFLADASHAEQTRPGRASIKDGRGPDDQKLPLATPAPRCIACRNATRP